MVQSVTIIARPYIRKKTFKKDIQQKSYYQANEYLSACFGDSNYDISKFINLNICDHYTYSRALTVEKVLRRDY